MNSSNKGWKNVLSSTIAVNAREQALKDSQVTAGPLAIPHLAKAWFWIILQEYDMNKIQLLESLGVCLFSACCGSIKALERLLSAVGKAAARLQQWQTRDGCKVQYRANIDYYCFHLSSQYRLAKSPPTPMTPPFLLPFLHPEAFSIRNDNSHGLNLDGLLETHVLNTSSQLVKPLGLKTWLAGTSSQGQGWDSKVISAPIFL